MTCLLLKATRLDVLASAAKSAHLDVLPMAAKLAHLDVSTG